PRTFISTQSGVWTMSLKDSSSSRAMVTSIKNSPTLNFRFEKFISFELKAPPLKKKKISSNQGSILKMESVVLSDLKSSLHPLEQPTKSKSKKAETVSSEECSWQSDIQSFGSNGSLMATSNWGTWNPENRESQPPMKTNGLKKLLILLQKNE